METGSKPDSTISPDTVYKLSDWGANSQKDYLHIKSGVSGIGLDVSKMTQGFLLATITSDDGMSFVAPYRTVFDKGAIRQEQTDLLVKLSWEAGLEELPEQIRERIAKARDVVEASDWAVESSFQLSRSAWQAMRESVEAEVELDEALKDASSYYHNAFLHNPEFNKFMQARPQD